MEKLAKKEKKEKKEKKREKRKKHGDEDNDGEEHKNAVAADDNNDDNNRGDDDDDDDDVDGAAPKRKKQRGKKKKKGESAQQEEETKHDAALAESSKDLSNAAAPTPQSHLVYVAGLPYDVEEEELRRFFAEGGVEPPEPASRGGIEYFTFPDSGRFNGICKVSFATESDSKRAITFDGTDFRGDGARYVVIKPWTKPAAASSPAAPSSDHAGAFYAPRVDTLPPSVYVGNLHFAVDEEELSAAFAAAGCTVRRVRLHTDPSTGQSRGFAHVDLGSRICAEKGLALDGQFLRGRNLRVGYAQKAKLPKGSRAAPS